MLTRRTWIQRTPFVVRPLIRGSRRWLKAMLDGETRRIVLARPGGCVTCGSFRRLECSHFYSRRWVNTRFDLVNCNKQCHDCNMRHNFDLHPYANWMQEFYGAEAVSDLFARRNALIKIRDDQFEEMLRLYRRM